MFHWFLLAWQTRRRQLSLLPIPEGLEERCLLDADLADLPRTSRLLARLHDLTPPAGASPIDLPISRNMPHKLPKPTWVIEGLPQRGPGPGPAPE
jgi:hypothetical protein